MRRSRTSRGRSWRSGSRRRAEPMRSERGFLLAIPSHLIQRTPSKPGSSTASLNRGRQRGVRRTPDRPPRRDRRGPRPAYRSAGHRGLMELVERVNLPVDHITKLLATVAGPTDRGTGTVPARFVEAWLMQQRSYMMLTTMEGTMAKHWAADKRCHWKRWSSLKSSKLEALMNYWNSGPAPEGGSAGGDQACRPRRRREVAATADSPTHMPSEQTGQLTKNSNLPCRAERTPSTPPHLLAVRRIRI